MKVLIYARVSTKDKQDAFNQINELRTYCSKSGYEIYKELIDYESGSSGDRTNFKILFEDGSKRKYDLLLFWSLDRFSREGARETINYLQQIESFNIKFKSYTELYLDSTGIFKDAIIALLATLAKQERIKISERVRAGLKVAKEKGRVGGRRSISKNIKDEIKELGKTNLSARAIGRQLNIDQKTVRNYLKLKSD